MRRVGTFIFIVISAFALIIVFHNSQKFDPGVDLPQVEAGEPFSRWHGIVVTCMPDGVILIDGEPAGNNPAKTLKEELETLERHFAVLREKMPQEWHKIKISFVPVLICIDKSAMVESFSDTIDVLCDAGCANLYVAVKRGQDFGARSFCMPVNAGWHYWHEQVTHITRNVQEMRARINKEGAFRLSSKFFSRWTGVKHLIILGEETVTTLDPVTGKPVKVVITKPPVHETIEPLFDMIEQHKEKNVIVHLDLNQYSKNLTWDWLVKLLARLEKAGIKGYSFAAPEIPY